MIRLDVTRMVLSGAALLVAATAYGEDWPQFRGPMGQGHSAARGLPLEWSKTKNVVWKQSLSGHGWSSPIVHRGRLYLTTAVEGDHSGGPKLSLRALCLSTATGRTEWSTEVFAREDTGAMHRKNTHASPTPLLENDRLYVHFGHNGTACLDLNGRVVWRNTELSYPPMHGNGGSPILVDNALFFSCDGSSDPFVAALDKQSGKLLWKTARQTDAKRKFSFSTPLLIEVMGHKQIISPGSGAVCAYDPKTGREIWRVRYGEGYSVVPRPVFGHGMIFIGTGFDTASVMAIRVDGEGDVTDTHVVWTLKKGAPLTPSFLLVGDELYAVSDSGIASCIDARTGLVHWQERVGGDYSASPLYADDRIYMISEQGMATVLKPGKEFVKLATNALEERALASFAATDGALFVRTEDHLYRLGTRTIDGAGGP